ncbi:MAG: winged helix-turn-helix domain-containing protein [Candidatus Thorarchaeota archaeon]|jgi:DNA-binding transcriptional ArsR family regulator
MSKKNEPDLGPEIDRVIHEPSRLRIMAQLYVVESADFTFLMTQLGFTWGNLSSHLTRLENAGYILAEKEFVGKKPRTTLSLTDVGRKAFNEYRATMKAVIEELPD